MDLISVIVPVYKVEAYLDQCVQSIVDQTYKNLEIILVDDGSPDNCPAMCDAWAQKDSRIKVIHKENGGLSDARNAGLAVATGAYIGFVDSDDYIAAAMYEAIMAHMVETDSDIAACGVQMIWEDGRTEMLTRSGSILLDNMAAMEAIISESWLKQPVWYKLYKRQIVEGIPFEKGKCHEDVFWSYQPVARANRVCVFDEPLYFYRQRSGSIMGTGFSEKRLDALEGKVRRLTFLKDNYPQMVSREQNRMFFFAMYLMQMAMKVPDTGKKDKEMLRQYSKKYSAVPVTNQERIWAALAKISFEGTCWIRNLLGVGL